MTFMEKKYFHFALQKLFIFIHLWLGDFKITEFHWNKLFSKQSSEESVEPECPHYGNMSKIVQWTETMLSKLTTFPIIHWVR